MSTITASLQGRFGNQCLTYLFCRALAQRTGSDLLVERWIGEKLFSFCDARPDGTPVRRVNAIEALQWSLIPADKRDNIEVRDYCQHQSAMIYRKSEAQSWLKIRPEIDEVCRAYLPKYGDTIICHLRRSDYFGYGYVVVHPKSYSRAMEEYGLDESKARFLSEEHQGTYIELPSDIQFAVDFYRMVNAPTLLRANSSFSFVAALLGNGLVLSPVIDGLEGGREQHCRFVAGNWPRLANFDFTTDLYVSP